MKRILAALILALILLLARYFRPISNPGATAQPKANPTPYRSVSTPRPSVRPTPRPTVKPTARPTPRPTAKPGSGKRRSLMPSPDTSGYYDSEDFYDYYRDDFSDYEEAEDYYKAHGGW